MNSQNLVKICQIAAEDFSVITPVPGGVGPLTVISLLENVLLAARNSSC